VIRHEAGEPDYLKELVDLYGQIEEKLHPECRRMLREWPDKVKRYKAAKYQFQVRDKVIEQDLYTESLSGLKIPKVSLPRYENWGDILRWQLTENVPGRIPLRRRGVSAQAGQRRPHPDVCGGRRPGTTNRRFHYVSQGMPAKRLSTAFDSVTLYGENPDGRPDIYGKIGNSGVSIATLDDAKKLYSGFNLCDPATSVSMTINGPAPMLLAFFLNAAIDQQCELYIRREARSEEVEARIREIYAQKGVSRPTYQGELPRATTGWGSCCSASPATRCCPRTCTTRSRPTR
jgi:methylmalonyl-CoA mutase